MQQATWKLKGEKIIKNAKAKSKEFRHFAERSVFLKGALKWADQLGTQFKERFPTQVSTLKRVVKNPQKEVYKLFNRSHSKKHLRTVDGN